MNWTYKSKTSLCIQKAFISQISCTNLSKSVLVEALLLQRWSIQMPVWNLKVRIRGRGQCFKELLQGLLEVKNIPASSCFCQYPATWHSHRRRVDHHTTGLISTTWSTHREGDVMHGGHTRYWLLFWPPPNSKPEHFSDLCCGQPNISLT